MGTQQKIASPSAETQQHGARGLQQSAQGPRKRLTCSGVPQGVPQSREPPSLASRSMKMHGQRIVFSIQSPKQGGSSQQRHVESPHLHFQQQTLSTASRVAQA